MNRHGYLRRLSGLLIEKIMLSLPLKWQEFFAVRIGQSLRKRLDRLVNLAEKILSKLGKGII